MQPSDDRSHFRTPTARTLVELLRAVALSIGDAEAFRIVRDQGKADLSISYRQLDQRARAIGGQLQSMMNPGDRALLLYPPGLEFISAFFGCLYAGVAAVPAAIPARHRSTASIEAIAEASDPAVILTTADHRELANQYYARLPALGERKWLATDEVSDDCRDVWRDPPIDGCQIAFLQYTSGSTSTPRGVMLSHENLLHNAALIQEAFGNRADGFGVSWLPVYHDMGLIGGVVQPVYCGGPCTLLAPAAFLQRPAMWLETISRTRATVSGGPDFAYDLCARRITSEERRRLDLSSWQVAFTGAERVRAETIQRFSEAFAPCGFRREAFFPCYGLAEATLMVSGGPRQTAPTIFRVRADLLEHHQIKEADAHDEHGRSLVGCGECLPGQTIAIVDPQTAMRCDEGRVGEIWVQGPSVARGYYTDPEATRVVFGARLRDTQEGPFLRTGDLGFLHGGQLFVTGRLKDVMIIRGRNFYPEDIEHSTAGVHDALRAGYSAAFSVEVNDRERLVVVQEIEPRRREVDADSVVQAVRRAIAVGHELEVYAVVLAKAGQIPKTSSGKTQRSACRDRFLRGQLEAIAQWTATEDASEGEGEGTNAARERKPITAAEVEEWLIRRISSRLGLSAAQVHVTVPFLEFGMGSVDAVEIAAELERWLGRKMAPTAIYNHPNIAALAQWLVEPSSGPEPSVRLVRYHRAAEEPHPERLLDEVQQMSQEEMEALIRQEMANQETNLA